MGKQQKRRKFPWLVVLAIPASIVALFTLLIRFDRFLEPNLAATASGGCWKVPLYVNAELKAIGELDAMCSDLGKKFSQLEETLVDPNSREPFAGTRKAADTIAGTIRALSPYEADDVELSRALYTIEIRNKSGESSNTLVLQTPDAKYVDYEVVGKTTTTKNLRGDKCRIVSLGRVGSDESIFISAWVISSVSNKACFTITHEGHYDVPIYMTMPVGRVAGWLNRPRNRWLTLFVMVLAVCATRFLPYQRAVSIKSATGTTGRGKDKQKKTSN